MMKTQSRPYFSSKVRHSGGTHRITLTELTSKFTVSLGKIYPLKVFASSQRRRNPHFLVQFPLCAMGALALSTVFRVFIWARRSSGVC